MQTRNRNHTADERQHRDFTFAWQGRRYRARLEAIRLAVGKASRQVWYVERDDGVQVAVPDEELSREGVMTRAREEFSELERR
jgi:hypothetical protein